MTSNNLQDMSYMESIMYITGKAAEAQAIAERDGMAFLCMTPDGLIEVMTPKEAKDMAGEANE